MKITSVRTPNIIDGRGIYPFWAIGKGRDMNSWFPKPALEMCVADEYILRYKSIVLREIRKGAFIYLDQALELLDHGSEKARAATRRSLDWALKKAREENNQVVADKIIVAMVIEDL